MWREEQRPPVVSICVPAYQAEDFLAATIDSVLAQSFNDWELIVLDNASTDRTLDVARSYDDPRIVVKSNASTLDLTDNWNAVAAMATGTYLKLLCADDVLHPGCVDRQVAVLEADPTVSLVASRRDFIGPDGEVVLYRRGLNHLLGRHEATDVVEQVVRSGINPVGWPSAMLFRRSDFEAVGSFDKRWLYPMDLELALRLLTRGAFFGQEEPLASFRISPLSASSVLKDQGAEHRSMIRAVADDPMWRISAADLRRGLFLSRLEEAKKTLLFAAVNSRRRWLRRLPGMVLESRSAFSGPETGGRRGDVDGELPKVA